MQRFLFSNVECLDLPRFVYQVEERLSSCCFIKRCEWKEWLEKMNTGGTKSWVTNEQNHHWYERGLMAASVKSISSASFPTGKRRSLFWKHLLLPSPLQLFRFGSTLLTAFTYHDIKWSCIDWLHVDAFHWWPNMYIACTYCCRHKKEVTTDYHEVHPVSYRPFDYIPHYSEVYMPNTVDWHVGV